MEYVRAGGKDPERGGTARTDPPMFLREQVPGSETEQQPAQNAAKYLTLPPGRETMRAIHGKFR